MDDSIYTTSSQGQLTPAPSLTAVVAQVVAFVQLQLPLWRDDPDRSSRQREETLNSELCDFLNSRARHELSIVRFHHEQEEELSSRKTDFSAKPSDSVWFAENYYSIYRPIVVFEGKRLPAPSRDREHEYVTGLQNTSGGIQRFKMGVHGKQCRVGVLVGYIQEGTLTFWHNQVNVWIDELSQGNLSDGQIWSNAEQLQDYTEDASARTSASGSQHPRPAGCVSETVQLKHLWIIMG